MSKPNIEKFPPVVDILTNLIQTNTEKRQKDRKRSMFKDIPTFLICHWGHINSFSLSVPLPCPQEN